MGQLSYRQVRDVARDMSNQVANKTSEALSRVHEAVSPTQSINVGDMERVVSTLAGGLLLANGVRRRSLFGAALAVGGGALIRRGLTGHCDVYEAMGRNTAKPQPSRLETPLEEKGPAPTGPGLDSLLASSASGA